MKRFLLKLLAFAIVYVVVTGAMVVALVAIERSVVHFRVPPGTRIVILGDSRPECAVNDRLIPGVWNFAHSGLHAFYSYLKMRDIVRTNEGVEWFLIEYSVNDVPVARDKWLTDTEKMRQYVPVYLFLMNSGEMWQLWQSNPRGFLLALGRLPPIALRDVVRFTLRKSLRSWGGYRALDRHKLRMDLKRLEQGAYAREGVAARQIEFVRRMMELALTHNTRVALLQTPIHEVLREFYRPVGRRYQEITHRELGDAPLLDHSDVVIPEDGFADLLHLNREGAEVYSRFLRHAGLRRLGCCTQDQGSVARR